MAKDRGQHNDWFRNLSIRKSIQKWLSIKTNDDDDDLFVAVYTKRPIDNRRQKCFDNLTTKLETKKTDKHKRKNFINIDSCFVYYFKQK